MNKAENFPASETPNYRGLKAVVIILGALILLAFGAMIAGLLLRSGNNGTVRAPYLTTIPVPAGASVAGAELAGNRLVVRVEGAGASEVILIEAASGRVVGRVVLQPSR